MSCDSWELTDEVVHSFHSAHQGTTTMQSRASKTTGQRKILILKMWETHATAAHASSYSKECLILMPHPRWPFQKICGDYFELNISPMLTDLVVGYVYAISQMVQLQSKNLITQCRTLFMNYGAPDEFSWDIGPRFTSTAFREFLQTWGVAHHLSSVSYPQFNDRAEAAEKTVKHIIQENVASNGSFKANKLVKTIMQYPNNLYLVYNLVLPRYFSTEYLPS